MKHPIPDKVFAIVFNHDGKDYGACVDITPEDSKTMLDAIDDMFASAKITLCRAIGYCERCDNGMQLKRSEVCEKMGAHLHKCDDCGRTNRECDK